MKERWGNVVPLIGQRFFFPTQKTKTAPQRDLNSIVLRPNRKLTFKRPCAADESGWRGAPGCVCVCVCVCVGGCVGVRERYVKFSCFTTVQTTDRTKIKIITAHN